MKTLTAAGIVAAFDQVDRPLVALPSHDLSWYEWADMDFLSWQHSSEPRAFIVVPLPERTVGLVLHPAGRVGSGMCDLCYGLDRTQGTTLMLAESWQRPRTKFGFHVCTGLNCSETVRGGPWIYRMHETISVGQRIERLQRRVIAVARTVTGLVEAKAG